MGNVIEKTTTEYFVASSKLRCFNLNKGHFCKSNRKMLSSHLSIKFPNQIKRAKYIKDKALFRLKEERGEEEIYSDSI